MKARASLRMNPAGGAMDAGRGVTARAVAGAAWLLLVCLGLLGLAGCGERGGSAQRDDARGGGVSVERAAAPPAAEKPAGAARAETGAGSAQAQTPVRANRGPRARLEVKPAEGYAGLTQYAFDSTPSSDDFDLPNEMFKRWDYDGDGTWDTPPSRAQRVTHVYPDSGVFHPRLLVRDSGGLQDSCGGVEITVRGSCPAPDFTLVDQNPNSPSYGQSYRLWDLHGRRVILWLAAPST